MDNNKIREIEHLIETTTLSIERSLKELAKLLEKEVDLYRIEVESYKESARGMNPYQVMLFMNGAEIRGKEMEERIKRLEEQNSQLRQKLASNGVFVK